MRTSKSRQLRMALAVGLSLLVLVVAPSRQPLEAGGPLRVLSDETLVRWFTFPIMYNTDGGPLGTLDNDAANALVAEAFGVWEAVATSTVATTRVTTASPLTADGDVNTPEEFAALGCVDVNPMVYDDDGAITDGVFGAGASDGILGFAGPCAFSTVTGEIAGGRMVLNGKGDDGSASFASRLRGTAVHELGHLLGLEHSVINFNCTTDPLTTCANGSDDIFGVPTMYPTSLPTGEVAGEDFANTLATDDIAWISFLYPTAGFAGSTGSVEGTAFFGNGVDGVQGGNVIARRLDDPATAGIDESRRIAVSNVSGWLAKADHGNTSLGLGANPFGTSAPARRGYYRIPGLPVASPTDYNVAIESIVDPSFVGGSSVGPVGDQRGEHIPLPGTAGNIPITVDAGTALTGQDFVFDDTLDSSDDFEPNNTIGTATEVGNGTFEASISPFASTDPDVYKFNATSGNDITIEIFARRLLVPDDIETASFLDSVIEIVSMDGTRQTTCDTETVTEDPPNPPVINPPDGVFDNPCLNDDQNTAMPATPDSKLVFRPGSTGMFFVIVSDAFGDARPDFQYRITISGADTPDADLVVTKTDNADPVTVGDQITYTITGTNNGPAVATNVMVTDTFTGAAVTIDSVTTDDGTCTAPVGGSFTCDLGTGPSGASATIIVVVTANEAGTITNTVSATADENDPNAANNTDIVQTTTVNAPGGTADLSVTKVDEFDPTKVDTSQTYTITITNNGPDTATNVMLTDTFSGPAVNIVFVDSDQGTCDPDPVPNPFTCDLGTLASGASTEVRVGVDHLDDGTVTNTAEVTASETDPNTDNNTAVETTVVEPITADLEIVKSDDNDPVLAGGTVTYTITVTNNGPDESADVEVVDVFSGAAVTIVSSTPGLPACSGPTDNFVCFLGVIPPGESRVITIEVTADEAGTITQTATVTSDEEEFDPDTSNNTAVETTTVNSAADLEVTKTDSPDPVIVGATLTYTVTVTNNGPDTATNVTLTDTLPAGTTFVSSNPGDPTCTHASGVVTCGLGDMASGASTVVTIEVTAPLTEGVITNTASVTGNVEDPDATNDTATEDTTVTPAADLEITKTDSPDPVDPAGTLTYTLTVTNNGPSDATGVTITDTLPAGTTFDSASAGCVHAAGVVTCDVGALANGASAMVTITVTAPGQGGVITNTASVSGDQGDPDTDNNTDSEDTTVNPAADLEVAKADSPDPVIVGATLTYTVTVTNNGPDEATGVTLTDTLPAGTTFVSATPGDPTCAHAAGVVTCNLGNLASGANTVVTIEVTAPDTAGTITNTASVTGNETDLDAANNSDTEDTEVTPAADLAITKSDDPDPVDALGTLTYTLTVTNNGPNDATGVTITDTLPAGTTFVSASAGCVHAAGVVTCDVGALANGASAMVTITVTAPVDGGVITNTAEVSGDQGDPDTANNTASEDTTVTAQVDLVVSKTDDPDPVFAGATLTYTVTVTNNGPSRADNVVLTDTLPAGTAFVSSNPGDPTCTHAGGVVTCDLGSLADGGSTMVTITVTAPAEGAVITNTASATADGDELAPADNTDTEDTTVTPLADLAVTKSDDPDPVFAGDNLTYTIVVTNLGPSTAENVVVSDTLPATTTFVSLDSPAGWSCTTPAVGSGGMVTCSIPSLPPGMSTFTLVVDTTVVGMLSNTVMAASTDPNATSAAGTVTPNGTADPNLDNNSDTEETTVVEADFVLSSDTPPQTIRRGESAVFRILLGTLGNFTGTVTFSASGLPARATVTFEPESIEAPGEEDSQTIMTVTVPAGQQLFLPPQPEAPAPPAAPLVLLWMLALVMAGMGFWLRGKRQAWRPATALSLVLLLASLGVVAMGNVACAGGFPAELRQPETFDITVTGTSGNLQRSTNVTLTVE